MEYTADRHSKNFWIFTRPWMDFGLIFADIKDDFTQGVLPVLHIFIINYLMTHSFHGVFCTCFKHLYSVVFLSIYSNLYQVSLNGNASRFTVHIYNLLFSYFSVWADNKELAKYWHQWTPVWQSFLTSDSPPREIAIWKGSHAISSPWV